MATPRNTPRSIAAQMAERVPGADRDALAAAVSDQDWASVADEISRAAREADPVTLDGIEQNAPYPAPTAALKPIVEPENTDDEPTITVDLAIDDRFDRDR